MVQDEDDASGEEDGHEADAQTEDPVVSDGDVEVECGEDGAPHHHVEHLLVGRVKKEAHSIPITTGSKPECQLFSNCNLDRMRQFREHIDMHDLG